jgi:hypothetical protein
MRELNTDEKSAITINLMQILENWCLSDGEQLELLKQENIKPRHLYQYRKGDKLFDFSDDFVERSQMILGIYDALGTTYPTNKDYGPIWLRREQKKFKGKTPIELMLSGKAGMKRVWYFLDCTQSWQD